MNRLILSFITLYLISAGGFCVDNMKFSDDDLKNFSMKTKPQKARNVSRLDQKSDVIYFEYESKEQLNQRIKELQSNISWREAEYESLSKGKHKDQERMSALLNETLGLKAELRKLVEIDG